MKILFFVFLFFFWTFCTLFTIFSFDGSIGIISYPSSGQDILKLSSQTLIKGQKVTGNFTARANGLGIVQLRFAHIPQVSFSKEDHVQFSIKEAGQKNWYSQTTFQGNIIAHAPFFPFGFPVIQKSLGKKYIFQLESLGGNNQNGLSASQKKTLFVTKYEALDAVAKANKKLIMLFIFKKIFNDLQIPDITFASVVYILPLLFFLLRSFDSLRQLSSGTWFSSLRMSKNVSLMILIGVALINVFLFQSSFLLVYITFACMGLLGIFWKFITEKEMWYVSFFFAILFVFLHTFYVQYASLSAGYTSYAFFGSVLVKIFINFLYEFPRNLGAYHVRIDTRS